MGDLLTGFLWVRRVGQSSIHVEIVLTRPDDVERVRGKLILVLTDLRAHRSMEIPEDIQAEFNSEAPVGTTSWERDFSRVLLRLSRPAEVASPRATTRSPRTHGLQTLSQIGPLTMPAAALREWFIAKPPHCRWQ